MSQRGFSLIEVVVCIALIGVLTTGLGTGYAHVERVRLAGIVKELEQVIGATQQQAAMRNQQYIIEASKEGVRVVHGATKVDEVKVNSPITVTIGAKGGSSAYNQIVFNGDLSPSKATTITLYHPYLKEEVQLTVRPVTGKVTIYNERKSS